MRNKLENELKKVLAEQLSLDVKEIKTTSKLIEDLGADSLDVVECMLAIEEEFKIEIKDEEAEKLSTVEDILNKIIELKK